MGNLIPTAKTRRVVILGIDAAGKTTILQQLGKVDIEQGPTLTFNVAKAKHHSLTFTFWDVGGQDSLRPFWRNYYGTGTGAIIYVVDSSDVERVANAKEELANVLHEEALANIPVVVLANKQDSPYAVKPDELGQQLGFERFERLYSVLPTAAKTGEGVDALLEWLSNYCLSPDETVSPDIIEKAVMERVKRVPPPAPPVPPSSGKGPFAEYALKKSLTN